LIPPDVQLELLDRLLHRDLANNKHQTNLHKFYDIPYDLTRPPDATGPFNAESSSVPTFDPLDPSIHKPLSISQVLHKKLRWMTLGGQYDWTNKVYPDEKPPDFPQDVADVVSTAFPDMKPEAAIVNVYSPGDTLSLHRDVSEHCDEGLVSISLGCEAIFVVGLAEEGAGSGQCLAIRLRSGDAVYMSGLSRYAWHGVPSIIPNSCPEHLASWPARASNEHDTGATSTPELFPSWKGWMQNKRINLNVRQIKP
jgi:alkylated DNA repair protein alkB family protein 1